MTDQTVGFKPPNYRAFFYAVRELSVFKRGWLPNTELDFESDEPVTYQHLSQHITQNQRSFLSRFAPLCPVCAVGLGTISGTVGVA